MNFFGEEKYFEKNLVTLDRENERRAKEMTV